MLAKGSAETTASELSDRFVVLHPAQSHAFHMIFTAVIALAFYQTVIAIARTEAQVRCCLPALASWGTPGQRPVQAREAMALQTAPHQLQPAVAQRSPLKTLP